MTQTYDIPAARAALKSVTLHTPCLPLTSARWAPIMPAVASAHLKLELFQQAGSFKARGAWLGIAGLDAAGRAAGVVAASGGNHAMAVSWAAQAAGVRARITMPRAADPLRVEECRAMGAEVTLCRDIADAFEAMNRIAAEEGATIMHPFEAPHMTLGAATCAAEFLEDAPEAEVFIIPVGGGGLISGMAMAIKQARPDATVIGVEPNGADSLYRSLAAGHPQTLEKVDTIADSLGSPMALPQSFALAQTYVDCVVRVSDDDLRASMRHYMRNLRIMAEPACAAALAGLIGPLKNEVAGRHVALIACGSNISPARYAQLLAPA